MSKMKCPECGSHNSRVNATDWRDTRGGLRRSRKCLKCRNPYATYEIHESTLNDFENRNIQLTALVHRIRHILMFLSGEYTGVDDLYLTESETAKLLGWGLNNLIRIRMREGNCPPSRICGSLTSKHEKVRYKYTEIINYMEQRYGEEETQEKLRAYENQTFKMENKEGEDEVQEQ